MQEIEAKILEIDRSKVEKKLAELGAVHAFTEKFVAIYFDTADGSIKETGKTLRLRQEGDRTVLTFKQKGIVDGTALSREETETEVEDSRAMQRILAGLGFETILEMHKLRSQYDLGGAHIVIDEYQGEFAHIPTYLEIEGPDAESVETIAVQLGYQKEDLEAVTIGTLIPRYAALSAQ